MSKKNNNNRNSNNPMANARTMAQEGMKIIRNIAFGTYNIYTDGHIFRNIEFVNAVITEVEKRRIDAGIHIAAMQYAYNGSEDPNVIKLLLRDRKTYEAYSLIRQVLDSIVATGGDTGFLLVLANKLPQYKYNI